MSLLAVQEISRQEESGFLLQEISFIQPKFKKIAIAGATGSGKTTLPKIIAGLLEPTAGAVLFAGARVEGPDEKLIPGHTHIAYLSQHFELLNKYRVRDYLGMASRLPDEEAARIYHICRIDH